LRARVVSMNVHRADGDAELQRDLSREEAPLCHLNNPMHVAAGAGSNNRVFRVPQVTEVVVDTRSRQAQLDGDLLRPQALPSKLADLGSPTLTCDNLFPGFFQLLFPDHISYL